MSNLMERGLEPLFAASLLLGYRIIFKWIPVQLPNDVIRRLRLPATVYRAFSIFNSSTCTCLILVSIVQKNRYLCFCMFIMALQTWGKQQLSET